MESLCVLLQDISSPLCVSQSSSGHKQPLIPVCLVQRNSNAHVSPEFIRNSAGSKMCAQQGTQAPISRVFFFADALASKLKTSSRQQNKHRTGRDPAPASRHQTTWPQPRTVTTVSGFTADGDIPSAELGTETTEVPKSEVIVASQKKLENASLLRQEYSEEIQQEGDTGSKYKLQEKHNHR